MYVSMQAASHASLKPRNANVVFDLSRHATSPVWVPCVCVIIVKYTNLTAMFGMLAGLTGAQCVLCVIFH